MSDSSIKPKPIHVFIDTNIWLSLYRYTSDDLDQLRKLRSLLVTGSLRLYLTEQVSDEFRRNRETIFGEAIESIKAKSLPNAFPQLCKQYPIQLNQMQGAIADFNQAKKRLLEQLEEDFSNQSLKADLVIKELHDKASRMRTTEEILNRARNRGDKGNPPGKKGSLGDAINWECLLAYLPDGTDLCIVAADSDWRSKRSEKEINSFLLWDWETTRVGTLTYFPTISDFLRCHFPTVDLKDQQLRERTIHELDFNDNIGDLSTGLDKLLALTPLTYDEFDSVQRIVWRRFRQFENEETSATALPLRRLQLQWLRFSDNQKGIWRKIRLNEDGTDDA